jgi:hypothetical protein
LFSKFFHYCSFLSRPSIYSVLAINAIVVLIAQLLSSGVDSKRLFKSSIEFSKSLINTFIILFVIDTTKISQINGLS